MLKFYIIVQGARSMKKSLIANIVTFMQNPNHKNHSVNAVPAQCSGSSSYACGGGAKI